MAQGKFGDAPRGGGSARACIWYALGEEAAQKVTHGQRDDPLQQEQKADLAALFAEARARDDLGAGAIWSPASGGGRRPSSIYARGVWSLETSAFDIECVSRTQPRVKQPVQHIIISLSEDESKAISDEQLIRRGEAAVDRAGFAGHQAVFTVHRDTPNAHLHVAVASVHAHTLKAWDRYHGWNRLHWALREMELEHGMQVEHGLAVVRDLGLPTQRIASATKAERLAWAQERGIEKERIENLARSFIADSDGVELAEDRRERIVTKLRKMLDDVDDRAEQRLRADVHTIAAGLAATIEPGPKGTLRLRMMDRADEGAVTREDTDSLGDTTQRMAKWVKSDTVFDVPLREIAPDAIEAGIFGEIAQRRAVSRREWLADLGDVARSEREVAEVLAQDPGRPSRDIVAGGQATFTAEDFDRWTCSRLSVDGPEWSDRVMREDKTLVVRSADSEHPLFTTEEQFDLERRVFDLSSKLTQERNPQFDRTKLDQAIADVEAAETKAKGQEFRLSDEQRGALSALEYRYGTVNGVAGAGKSSAMSVVKRYGELTNQPVVGIATAQLAAENLSQKSGIDSVNSDRGLALEAARGKELVKPNSIVIVDEYSMTSLEAAKEHLERIDARPDAAILYIGGGAQLENIRAGNTHRVLTEAAQQHGRHHEITETRRFVGESVAWMRDVVPALDKAILEVDAAGARRGFSEFEAHGHLVYHADRKAEIAGKTEDIVSGYERGLKVIAPGCERIEVKYVNRAVRERLGHVGKGILYQLEHRKREFSPEDRVVFTKNAERSLGVLNGYTGTVTAVELDSITVKLDSGRTIDVDPVKYPHLEWGYAVTTHKSQGAGDPIAVVSLTKSDDARSAYVALTRCEQELHVHTRLKTAGGADPEKREVELLDHLTSDASLRPKDDALLFEDIVKRTGGPDTPWAKAVRRAFEQEADPLRQQHRAEQSDRFEARGTAVIDVLTRTRAERDRAERLVEPKRAKRFAAIAAIERRDIDAVDKNYALEPFTSWAVRRRKEIEREIPFLDKSVERREQHKAQRVAHDAQAPQSQRIRTDEKLHAERELQPERQTIQEQVATYSDEELKQFKEQERAKRQVIDTPRRGFGR